eukprot:m51a1_g3876 hypothetical protein (149) ;mRNA; f:26560-27292
MTDATFANKYILLMFYFGDHTVDSFSELSALNEAVPTKLPGCVPVAVTCVNSIEDHESWASNLIAIARSRLHIGPLANLWLLSDIDRKMANDYGVLVCDSPPVPNNGRCMKAMYLIDRDPQRKILVSCVYDFLIQRVPDEVSSWLKML